MRHPIETTVETMLAQLRQMQGTQLLPGNGEVFLPGLWSSYDSDGGVVSGSYQAGDGAVLRVSLAVERPGRWCTLSLSLGQEALPEGAVLSLVADLRASRPVTITLMLRSVIDDHNSDVVLDDRFEAGPQGGVQVALLAVPPGSVLCAPAQRRLLILDLPQLDMEMEIRDMRLFVLLPEGLAQPLPAQER